MNFPKTQMKSASASTEAKPRSGTVARVLTAAILIPAVVALVWWGPPSVIAAMGGVVALLALVEFFSLGEHLSLHAYRAWTCICALGIFYQQWAATTAETHQVGRGVRSHANFGSSASAAGAGAF